MRDQRCENEYIRRIHKVQDYIENHIDEPMTVDKLAEVAGFSTFHFCRIFQAIVHESLGHFVTRIRMEQILFQLAHRSDRNMTDIALEFGYSDSAVFSRTFRNYYGVSPREYRSLYCETNTEPVILSEYNKAYMQSHTAQTVQVEPRITIETLRPQQAVYVRHTGNYITLAKAYRDLIDILFMEAENQGLLIPGKNQVLAMYHDNPEFTKEDSFRTSLCLTVPDEIDINRPSVTENGILGSMKLEGGLYAIGHFAIHQDQYAAAWDYMYQEWICGSGYIPRNYVPFELYRNNPETSSDHIHLVDIYLPIEPIS